MLVLFVKKGGKERTLIAFWFGHISNAKHA